MPTEKKHRQINADKLAKKIRDAAHKATAEEDLKMSVEPLLQNVFTQMGVDVEMVKYEKAATRFKGKADAVYGYVTMEYKVPGKLSGRAGAQKVSEQLQRYLSEQAKEVGQQAEDFLEKAVGIALDGEQILFVRFAKVAVLLQTPVPIEGAQQIFIPEIGADRGFQVSGRFPSVHPASATF